MHDSTIASRRISTSYFLLSVSLLPKTDEGIVSLLAILKRTGTDTKLLGMQQIIFSLFSSSFSCSFSRCRVLREE